MKAVAVVPGTREVRLIEHDEPRVTAAADVKLRMLEVGVCGTDREICAFQYGTPPDGSAHLVIGHESLGEVVEVGPAVSGLKPGDLVVPMVRRPCPHAQCTACRAGREAFEGAIRDLGIFQQRWPGAVRALLTGRYPVEAHRELLVGPARGIKNVLTFA